MFSWEFPKSVSLILFFWLRVPTDTDGQSSTWLGGRERVGVPGF